MFIDTQILLVIQLFKTIIEPVKELPLKYDKELIQVDIEVGRVLGLLVPLHKCPEFLVYLGGDRLLRGVCVRD